MDVRTLQKIAESPSQDERRLPDIVSHLYLHQLHSLTRRDDSRLFNGNAVDGHVVWPRADDMSEMISRFQTYPGGTITALCKLVQAQIGLMPRYPKLVDYPAAACSIVADIVRESC